MLTWSKVFMVLGYRCSCCELDCWKVSFPCAGNWFFCQVDFWLVFAKQSADLLDGDIVCVCVFTDGELVNLPGTAFCVFCIEIWNKFGGTLASTSPTRAAWLSLCCSKHVIFPFGLWSVWFHYKTQNDHMSQSMGRVLTVSFVVVFKQVSNIKAFIALYSSFIACS